MNTPTIETQRLILRRFTQDDARALYQILSDEEVNTFLPKMCIRDRSQGVVSRFIYSLFISACI